jgi:hypothetical protein
VQVFPLKIIRPRGPRRTVSIEASHTGTLAAFFGLAIIPPFGRRPACPRRRAVLFADMNEMRMRSERESALV